MRDSERPAIMRGTDFNGNTSLVKARLLSSEEATGTFSSGSSAYFSVVVNLVVGVQLFQ